MAELEASELMRLVNTIVAHACMGQNRAAATLLHRATPAAQAAVGILVRRLGAIHAAATGVVSLPPLTAATAQVAPTTTPSDDGSPTATGSYTNQRYEALP